MNGENENQPPESVEHHEVTVIRDTIPQTESAPEPTIKPPETVVEVVQPEVAASPPKVVDNKWFGVPPAGERPLPGIRQYVVLILFVMVIEIGIWAVYRYFSAPYFENFGTLTFYLAHIIAAPAIHLIPILIFWRVFRKERGVPFVFTKKLLMSAVIVGFFGAIIWRVIQELSYDSLAGVSGGTVSGTFNFFNLFAATNITLFSVMTFVQFFIVGPVEELEFRGFSYDQSTRVLPNWQALLFSSVLFGCSHIPIALFVYQFPPHIFAVALFGWISAGVVFGALYMWSRNIFACIVMHGMGNWQLSVYYFQSTETGGMGVGSVVAVDVGTTLIADGAMIIIFFLIHKYYWQPHRRGEPAFGGSLARLQNFLHEHDFMQKPLKTTAVFLVAFIVVTCGIIMGLTHALGESDLTKMFDSGVDRDNGDHGFLSSYIEQMEQQTGSGTLNEGQTETLTLQTEPEKYIQEVTIAVTWEDEDDIVYGPRVYNNEPDTFSVMLSGLNQTERDSTSNPEEGQGEITLKLNFTQELLEETIITHGDVYEILIEIELVEAGDFFPAFGAVGFTDTSNEYSYEIEITWLVPE